MQRQRRQTNKDIKTVQTNPASTWLNPGIKTIEQLKDWVYIKLGAPLLRVELTDEQLNSCIGDALAVYTKYAYVPPKYLVVNLKHYKSGVGIDLSQFKIMQVDDIAFQRDSAFGLANDLFFGPYAFFGQGPGSPMFGLGNGNWVGSWVSYHNMHEFFDLTKRMLGSQPDWQYDRATKLMKLMPEPRCAGKSDHYILLTCTCEQPLEEYFGNEYVRRLVLAEAKILLGTIRKKFQNVALTGGASIDTSIGDEGREEKQQIMENIIKDEARGQTWVIA